MMQQKEKIEQIIKDFDIENIIDNYLIEKKIIDKNWFYYYKIIPYLSKRFKYYWRK